ncbi:sulfite exporter TauE/SafE family protein [Flavobacteriales bacterium]|jgi:uncharacterized membrane protein YfcA|nr:sulfite exporter TauE/SafE family protein [Flavobacteriales bacterium]
MDILNFAGVLGAILIGVVLGLTGGGGSILTVPILVYLLGINPITATGYSLFIVGSASMIGALRNAKLGMIDYRTGIVFAIPAFISVYITRKYLVPAIPDVLLTVNEYDLTKDVGIMVFFASVMLAASISMIKGRKEAVKSCCSKASCDEQKVTFNYPMIIAEGLVVGILTGVVGAGGGFLIIPALVLFAKLPMKKAVATSLMIISIKSLIGFLGDVQNVSVDWVFLLTFTSLSILGIMIGIYLNKFIDGKKLKTAFGWFVLLMGFYMIIKELFL